MRWLRLAMAVALTVVAATGCTTAAKKGARFVFGPTDASDWLAPDAWHQLDAPDKAK